MARQECKYSALGVTLTTNAPAFPLFVVFLLVAYAIFASFWGLVIWAVAHIFTSPSYGFCWLLGLVVSLFLGIIATRSNA